MAEPSESSGRSTTAAAAADRRREARWASKQLVKVIIQASGKSLEGRTVDMSTAGMRVRGGESIAVGEKVRVEGLDFAVFGEVRWCAQIQDGQYDAGILVTVWDEG